MFSLFRCPLYLKTKISSSPNFEMSFDQSDPVDRIKWSSVQMPIKFWAHSGQVFWSNAQKPDWKCTISQKLDQIVWKSVCWVQAVKPDS